MSTGAERVEVGSEVETGRRLHAWAPIAGVLLLSFAVSAWKLSTPSIWFDEAASWENVAGSWGYLFQRLLHGADSGGFLYALILKLWTACFGTSELALRLPSSLAALGFTALMIDAARRLWGTRAGLCAGVLAALHPEVVFWARQSRAYVFVLLAAAGCVWALARLQTDPRGRRRGLALAAIFSGALCALHIYGIFLSGALWGMLAVGVVPLPKRERRWALCGLAMIAVFALAWGLLLEGTIEAKLDDFWLQSPYPVAYASIFRWLWRPVWLVAPLVGVALAWLAVERSETRKVALALVVLATAVLLGPLLPSLLSEGAHHYIHPRYCLPLVPLTLLPLGFLASRTPALPTWLGVGLVAWAGFDAGGVSNLYRPSAPYGYNAREVAQYLEKRLAPGARVHVYAGHQALTLAYYGVGRKGAIVPGHPTDLASPDTDASRNDWRVFFSRGGDLQAIYPGIDASRLVRIGGMRLLPPKPPPPP